MPSLSDVLTPQTADDIEAIILGILQALEFPVTSWQPGSVPRTLKRAFSEVIADLTTTIADIAAGGYLDLAEGIWLDLLATFYDRTRNPALFTEGLATLTDTASAGPYTITVGQLFIQDAAGHRYTNITAGTLNQGSTLQLTWRAEAAGADYNTPVINSITQLVTVLPGVTVNNPDPGSGDWITSPGADEENDALFRQRCRDRWATLGTGGNIAAYRAWAQEGAPTVTRVAVDASNPGGPGTVWVYLANEAGAASAQEVADADALIQERKALTANVTVFAATNLLTTISATIYVKSSDRAQAEIDIPSLLGELRKRLNIGETLYLAQLIEEFMTPQGVVNVTIATPAANVLATGNQVHTFAIGPLTWVEL